MKREINKIAIVRLSALGDIVNSAVVLQFIDAHFKNVEIEWITEEAFSPLLQSHPLIKSVHSINLKRAKKERSFSQLKEIIKKLKSLGHFDIIIDMQGLLKSAIVARVIGKETHGFDKNSSRESISSLFYKTTSNIGYTQNILKRNCFVVADGLNFEINDEMLLNKKAIFPFKKLPKQPTEIKEIAIVIGASWESKIYPKERVVELINALKGCSISIIWGSDKEKSDAEWIVQNSQNSSLAPKLSLIELVSFISNMDLVIGNDTGPTHMAWAQNVASITLFGPTTTRMIYETPINIGIESPSKVDINNIDKNDFSIKEIPVSKILLSVEELLYGV
jgi:heptosyltransferase-1